MLLNVLTAITLLGLTEVARAEVIPAEVSGGMPTLSDYPNAAQRADEQGTVFVRLLVAPTGRAQRCTIIRTSGSSLLDGTTCAVFLKRTRFKPARGRESTATYGILNTAVTWIIPDSATKPAEAIQMPPDLSLTVNRLPTGIAAPAIVNVVLSFDATGHSIGYAAARDTIAANLAPLACSQISKDWPAQPERDDGGVPVPYVRTADVQFSTG